MMTSAVGALSWSKITLGVGRQHGGGRVLAANSQRRMLYASARNVDARLAGIARRRSAVGAGGCLSDASNATTTFATSAMMGTSVNQQIAPDTGKMTDLTEFD